MPAAPPAWLTGIIRSGRSCYGAHPLVVSAAGSGNKLVLGAGGATPAMTFPEKKVNIFGRRTPCRVDAHMASDPTIRASQHADRVARP